MTGGACHTPPADLLRHAFNIKTVGDLGKNKHFRAAQALSLLGETGAK